MLPENFYLGTDKPHWLWRLDVPLFVSNNRLKGRRTPFPRGRARWALDSGGYTVLNTYGTWTISPEEYIDSVRRYMSEIGGMEWAAAQDWMTEPWVLAKTGLTVEDHQRLTVDNYVQLCQMAPEVPWAPVLQGWEIDDYAKCVDIYVSNGVDLTSLPVVGVGSVCRRQSTNAIGEVFGSLNEMGLTNLHGFGVKRAGLMKYGNRVQSADSMAWSFTARQEAWKRIKADTPTTCPEGKRTCSHCVHYALEWRENTLTALL